MLAIAAVGCGGAAHDPNRPKTVPVTVVITYQQKPVEGATVSFVAEGAGHSATALTDASGRAALTTFATGDGAVPGKYRVGVSKVFIETLQNPNDPGGPPLGSKQVHGVPQRYNDAAKSGLTAEVTDGGKNEFPFALAD